MASQAVFPEIKPRLRLLQHNTTNYAVVNILAITVVADFGVASYNSERC